jgi:L-seryl-tRNA(Ser) seleniumtransferase
MPSLKIFWDRKRFGIAGDTVVKTLFDTDPRVGIFPARGESDSQTGVTVNPYMMAAGDEKIVADRLYALLTGAPRKEAADPLAAPAADLSGSWDVRVEYAAGASNHSLYLRQRGNEIDGAHRGDFISRDVTGTIDGDNVKIRSAYGESNGDALNYTFSGKVSGDTMSGPLDLGEYLGGRWTANRRVPRRG